MKNLIFVLISLIALSFSFQAHAAKVPLKFGTDEKVQFIAETGIEGPDNKKLYLGHIVEMKLFLLPYTVTSKGYVLGVKGDSHSYYDFPTGERLKELQQQGLLPDPLPAAKIGWLDYLFGYSLWIILLIVVGSSVVPKLFSRKKADDQDIQS